MPACNCSPTARRASSSTACKLRDIWPVPRPCSCGKSARWRQTGVAASRNERHVAAQLDRALAAHADAQEHGQQFRRRDSARAPSRISRSRGRSCSGQCTDCPYCSPRLTLHYGERAKPGLICGTTCTLRPIGGNGLQYRFARLIPTMSTIHAARRHRIGLPDPALPSRHAGRC